MNCKNYTQANISEDVLFWLFGVQLGYIDTRIISMQDLANEVDRLHTKEEILEIINGSDKHLFY